MSKNDKKQIPVLLLYLHLIFKIVFTKRIFQKYC